MFALLVPVFLALVACAANVNAATGSVALGSMRQTIQGFGGSSAWMGAMTDAQMNTLFGNGNNNQYGLSLLRLRIDPGKSWANELSNAQKAGARGAQVFATPWSPPASMKSNNNVVGGSLNTASYGAYAAYLKSFVDYLKAGGVSLYAISVNNEPDITVTYESCDWTAAQLVNFVKNYGSAVGTKLIAAESFKFNKALTDPILSDSSAVSQVSIIAGHIYGSGLADYSSAQNKGKQVWMTEHYNAGFDWTSMMATAKEIHDAMTVASYNAYVWWWFVDLNNEFTSLTDKSGNPTKRGYIMAQWSKYIRPGYTRVDATYQPTTNVFLSAYKSGSKVVLVAVNTGSSAVSQTFSLSGGTIPASFTPHITSSSKSLSNEASVSVKSGAFTYSLPGQSVTTFVSN
uniref:Glucosylceramidase n=1 Tax=Radopholus similis TaxID=46012 RepID=B3TJG3_RADSI|nr:xylanase [Radopholus similis]